MACSIDCMAGTKEVTAIGDSSTDWGDQIGRAFIVSGFDQLGDGCVKLYLQPFAEISATEPATIVGGNVGGK